DIKEFLDQINEVRNVRGHLTEIVAEQPYLTQRVRSLVRFSLSAQYKPVAPENRGSTRSLKAMPDRFVTSGIGLSDSGELVTISQQNKLTGREEWRATVESGKS